MNHFQDSKIVIDIDEEKDQKVWMITTTIYNGKKYVAMARDIFGDMTLDDCEELLEKEKYTEEEAERICIEWSKKTGLDFLNS